MPPGARRSHVTRLVVMLRTHALSLGMAPGAAPGDQLACNEAAASHLGTSIRGLFSLLYSSSSSASSSHGVSGQLCLGRRVAILTAPGSVLNR